MEKGVDHSASVNCGHREPFDSGGTMFAKLSRAVLSIGLAVVVCLGLVNQVHASDLQQIAGAKEVWEGLYEGELDWTHEPRLIKNTDHIPGNVGATFGIYFTLQTVPPDARGIVRLHYKTVFPAAGIRNPRSGEIIHEIDGTSECILGKACLAGYTFDTPEEIVPGEWHFIISFRNAVLLDKRFIVEPRGDSFVLNN